MNERHIISTLIYYHKDNKDISNNIFHVRSLQIDLFFAFQFKLIHTSFPTSSSDLYTLFTHIQKCVAVFIYKSTTYQTVYEFTHSFIRT